MTLACAALGTAVGQVPETDIEEKLLPEPRAASLNKGKYGLPILHQSEEGFFFLEVMLRFCLLQKRRK